MSISVFSFILCLVVVFLVGALVGYAASLPQIGKLRASLEARSEQLAAANISEASAVARSERLEEENDQLITRAEEESAILRTLTPLAKQLETMGLSVQKLRELQLTQSEQIKQQLGDTHQLHIRLQKETSALNTALTSTSARGYWGEIELQRLVESAGMVEHVDFDVQKSTSTFSPEGTHARPDVTIHLPGNTHIAIDAKAPFNALLEAANLPSQESAQRTECLTRHAKALKSHISQLEKRNYPADFPGSPTFTLLFIPAESLLSDALEASPDILEYALARSVILTTPSTLLLTLRSVATMWINAKANEESEEIIRLGRTLTARLTTVANHLSDVGKHLTKAVAGYNKTVASMETRLLKPIRDFEALDAPEAPQEISPDEAQIHTFVALPVSSEDD